MENKYEGQEFRQTHLRALQDCATRRSGAGDLQQSPA